MITGTPASADMCGGEDPNLRSSPSIQRFGTQMALFIFAKFPDGMDIAPDGTPLSECSGCGPGWPDTSTTPPAWKDFFLEQDDPPVSPGSLSHFFYAMSLGQHRLKGRTLDTLLVAPHDIEYYEHLGGSQPIFGANADILAKADSLVNFAEFDSAGPHGLRDGRVDFIFINWQSTTTKADTVTSLMSYAAFSGILGAPVQFDGVEVGRGATLSAIVQDTGEGTSSCVTLG